MSTLAERLQQIQQSLPAHVTLIAVCKRQPLEKVREAYALGLRDFGENTAQGLQEKAEALRDLQIRWHFIGHLQRNKVNVVLRYAHVVHTIDRFELMEALRKRAPRQGLDVFVQVNIGREAQKSGVAPEDALSLCRKVAAPLRLLGLMAIPPADVDPEPYFRRMQILSGELQAQRAGAGALSMGMSGDYEKAMRCGATHIRVGEALFGGRQT